MIKTVWSITFYVLDLKKAETDSALLFSSAFRAEAHRNRYSAFAVGADFQHKFRTQQGSAEIAVARN
jgi:hypothetical protein